MTASNSRIGIFWIYYERLISRSILLSKAKYSSLGIADTCFSHISVWETEKAYLPEFPTLMNSEYQMFPRGRVLFEKRCATFKIFADSTIIKNKRSRKLIIDTFSLQDEKCKWKRDTHYAVF